MNLGFSRRNVVRNPSQKSHRPHKRRRLFFDCLEERRLLTAGTLSTSPAQVFAVASYPPGNTAPGNTLDPSAVAWTSNRAVAMDSQGDAVVAWDDSPTDPTTHQPTGTWTMNFQLYTEGTNPTTGETQLNAGAGGPLVDKSNPSQVVTANEGSPMVAMAPTSGNFAVAWETSSSNSNGSIYSTYVQLYSKAGTPLTDPIMVGSAGDATLRSIAMDDTGFDVLYAAIDKQYSGNQYQNVTVQRYTTTGAANGSPIKVTTTLEQNSPSAAMAMDGNGNFVVGWGDVARVGNRFSSYVYDLHWQRYTSAGKAAEAAKQEQTSYLPFDVNLAMDSNDDFVFTWNLGNGLQSQEISASDGLGSQNTVDAAASMGRTAIAMQPATGAYVLSWTDTTGGQSGSSSVYAATYSLNGTAETSPFVVYAAPNVLLNGRYSSLSHTPSAAIDPAGNVLTINAGYATDNTSTVYTDGGEFGQFYLDPPAPAATSTSTSSPTNSSSTAGAASPSASTTAATDAVFAAYAYSQDDDTLE